MNVSHELLWRKILDGMTELSHEFRVVLEAARLDPFLFDASSIIAPALVFSQTSDVRSRETWKFPFWTGVATVQGGGKKTQRWVALKTPGKDVRPPRLVAPKTHFFCRH